MQQTPNLSLNKPEGPDVVNIEDLNVNMDIIDTKLGGTNGHDHSGTPGNGPKLTSAGLAAGAADDAAIGNRTITDTVVAESGAGTVTNLLSKIGYMIKSITGKANWYTLPAITLETINNLFGGISGHSHNGTAGQGPKIAYTNISGTPTELPASKLVTARKIEIAGDVSGSGVFDATQDLLINTTIKKSIPSISILTGKISGGGTIPLPDGYTQEQCHWFVSVYYCQAGDKTDVYCYADDNRVVTCYDPSGYTGIANYMIIGVK